MVYKIKNNFSILLTCVCLIVIGSNAIFQYVKRENRNKYLYEQMYIECQAKMHSEGTCMYYAEPLKNNDTVSTFGYITLNEGNISFLQIGGPLFVIFAAVWNFHRNLRKGVFKNSLTRMGYKEYMRKSYIQTLLKGAFILPIFLLIIFIISYLLSGHFDYEYGIRQYGYDAFGIDNAKHWVCFLIVYLFNFVLQSILWINIGILNCKHNKHMIINIVVSQIEYFMLFIILEMVGTTFFPGTSMMYYLSLSNTWAYTHVTRIGMICFYLVLALLSTCIVYVTYRNKEKIIMEMEK